MRGPRPTLMADAEYPPLLESSCSAFPFSVSRLHRMKNKALFESGMVRTCHKPHEGCIPYLVEVVIILLLHPNETTQQRLPHGTGNDRRA
jgi:hypothetical protein